MHLFSLLKNPAGLALMALIALPVSASAEEVLFVSPTRVEVSDSKKVEVINVTNLSNIKRAYKISINDMIMTEAGVTSEVSEFDYSAKRMLRFVPRQFEIQPGQKQVVRVMVRAPADLKDGQYHSHVHFLEDVTKRDAPEVTEGKAIIIAPLAYSAMIPVIVTHGKIDTTIAMQDATVKKIGDKKYKMSMIVTRSGNGQGTGHVEIAYIKPDGTELQLTKRATVNIYRELDKRNYSLEFELPPEFTGGGKAVVRFYNSKDPSSKPISEAPLNLPA